MSKEEVQNADGTIDVVETYREAEGQPQVRRYTRPGNNTAALQ